MLRIEHIAFWVRDLEKVKQFYQQYFGLLCNEKYTNPKKQFESYFLSFPQGGARIELMHMPGITANNVSANKAFGLAHVAITVGDENAVDALTERLRADRYTIAGEPRRTGDGYYESAVLDPEGNLIEITAG
jgi:lactoylglutathione lyase